MNRKPVVIVTRKLPEAVEQKLAEDFEPILNPDDKLYSVDELLELAEKADAILPCHTEKFSADTIARLPANIRAIANFSVGVDHVERTEHAHHAVHPGRDRPLLEPPRLPALVHEHTCPALARGLAQ